MVDIWLNDVSMDWFKGKGAATGKHGLKAGFISPTLGGSSEISVKLSLGAQLMRIVWDTIWLRLTVCHGKIHHF